MSARVRSCRRCPARVGYKRFYCDPCLAVRKDEERAKNRLHMAAKRQTPEQRERERRATADYRRRNREKVLAAGRRDGRRRRLRREYGLTLEDFGALLIAHGFRCAICRRWMTLHVDHDHETGSVRGLLCGSCNRAIGQLGESPDRMRSAALYIEAAA